MGGSLKIDEILMIPKNFDIFVETGTYHGKTTCIASPFFKIVCTIEIDEKLYNFSKNNFKIFPNIISYFGDSVNILPKIINKYSKIVFFLDAHISGRDSSWNSEHPVPLLKELQIISRKQESKNFLIIIDDFRLWSLWGITIEKILNFFPKYQKHFIHEDRFWIYV